MNWTGEGSISKLFFKMMCSHQQKAITHTLGWAASKLAVKGTSLKEGKAHLQRGGETVQLLAALHSATAGPSPAGAAPLFPSPWRPGAGEGDGAATP